MVKESTCKGGQCRRPHLIPGLGRSARGGDGKTLQYSCLENPMDRGAWQTPQGHKEWDMAGLLNTHSRSVFFFSSLSLFHSPSWP